MIEWNKLPKEPWNELEENTFIIFLPKSDRAVTATHDAANHYFIYTTEDTEHIFPYRYVSHYAEINWPEEVAHERSEASSPSVART